MHGEPSTACDDSALLALWVNERRQDAFAQLVAAYQQMVVGAALRRTGDVEAARDVAQQVFSALAAKAPWLAGAVAQQSSAAMAELMPQMLCPEGDAKEWRARRTSALVEATKRVEALIPPARLKPNVVAQSLALGDAYFSEVQTRPDGHGSVNFGIRLPGVSGRF